jgi:large subunit ribosomal protein L1
MPNIGKRHKNNITKVDKSKLYSPTEAIELLKTTAKAKFDESVEVHVGLGIDPKQGDQQVRGTIVMPHSIGKDKRVAVFAEGEAELEAKKAGADLVGSTELIDKIRTSGKIDFDVAVATPEMMAKLAQVAKVLGPRGLMPSPKNETVTKNVGKAVKELKAGKIAFKNDNTSNLHQMIGKISAPTENLVTNYEALLEAIKRAKPASSKGTYVKHITLTTTMGPGVPIQQ